MFGSLLQLFGFPPAKPVHSRPDQETLPVTAPMASKAGKVKKVEVAVPAQPVQEKPVRRTPVKTQVVKKKTSAEPVAVVSKPVKASKPVSPAKAAPSQAKPGKTAAPVVAKAAPKAATKASTKPDSPPAKPAPTKKVAAKATPVVQPVLSPLKKKTEAVSTQTPVLPKAITDPAPVKPAVKSAGPELQMTPSGVPVRTGRPSSRLAQLTVPSMAQSVASTAAKASFTRIAAPQPIVPPLASATKRDPKLADNWKNKPVAELTDAEVIAMPEDAYMNETQLAYFRLKLVALKKDILSNAGETTEHLREDTVVVPDPADRATIEEEHALELRTRDRERKLLKKIEQSIGLIDSGDYGYCDETGEPIGVGRLLARPTATLSLEAQQRRELKQRMFGD